MGWLPLQSQLKKIQHQSFLPIGQTAAAVQNQQNRTLSLNRQFEWWFPDSRIYRELEVNHLNKNNLGNQKLFVPTLDVALMKQFESVSLYDHIF